MSACNWNHSPMQFMINSNKTHLWCDQAKSVWSRWNSVFIFLTNCMHHFYNYILQKTPLKLVNWFQRYEQLKDPKNNRKQKAFSALFGSILKSIFSTSDWFCLITSHLIINVIGLPYIKRVRRRRHRSKSNKIIRKTLSIVKANDLTQAGTKLYPIIDRT